MARDLLTTPRPSDGDEYVALEEASPRNRILAFTLASFLGFLGAHRFYTGRPWTGLAMLLTGGGFLIWWIADVFVLLSGRFKDGQGRVLGPPRAIERSELKELPDETRRQLADDTEDPDLDELLEDPIDEEFARLEREVDGDTQKRDDRGRDGRV